MYDFFLKLIDLMNFPHEISKKDVSSGLLTYLTLEWPKKEVTTFLSEKVVEQKEKITKCKNTKTTTTTTMMIENNRWSWRYRQIFISSPFILLHEDMHKSWCLFCLFFIHLSSKFNFLIFQPKSTQSIAYIIYQIYILVGCFHYLLL